MTIDEIIRKLGGTKAVARAIGRRATTVRMWIYNGAIPEHHHATLLRMSDDATAGVTKGHLRNAR